MQSEVESKYEQKKDSIATKEDINRLDVKIESVRADLIKWMFIFIIGQTAVIITVLKLFFS